MIVRERSGWWAAIFATKGTTWTAIRRRVLITFLLSVIVTVLHELYGLLHVNLTTTPFALIGLALSIFLGFRNNTSYDRFWEGRKLWGRLVNVSRTLARQVDTFVEAGPDGDNEDIRRTLVLRQVAYVHAVRMHLRGESDYDALRPWIDDSEIATMRGEANPPQVIMRGTGQRLRALWQAGRIDTLHLPALDASLTENTTIQGACERIKSTPIPYVYTVLMHRIVAVYCMTLPFGLITAVGPLTPFVVLMIAYAFYGIDAVGSEIEDPFGEDTNDLPLQALSTMIEVNLKQWIDADDVPPLAEPRDGVLR